MEEDLDQEFDRVEARLASGEAYMMCNECGAKLWSFDGNRDADRTCPYKHVEGMCQ
jgi:hypothetical protein